MPFITGGYPSLDVTTAAIEAIAHSGASIIEVGIPFSDPIADGPVIAASMHDALQNGADPHSVFNAVRAARAKTSVGLVAMVSVSIVTRIGAKNFISQAAESGFDGLIVPDMDLSQARELSNLCESCDIALALLVAPTTSPARMAQITESCRGFIYLLARAGLTGEQESSPEISGSVNAIRSVSKLPIAAGFGISTPEHVAAVTKYADAAIVGSALVRRMGKGEPVSAAADFTRLLATGLRTGLPASSFSN